MNLVFDFGAVVFNWRPMDLLRSHLADQCTEDVATQDLAHKFFAHPDWQAFDRGTVTVGQVVRQTSSRLGLMNESVSAVLAAIPDHLTPIAGTVRLLDDLRKLRGAGTPLRLFYLSSMPAPVARELERRHEFLKWFDGGIFSGDVKLIKPEKEIFELATGRFGLTAASTVFVDDALANVESARAHGWRAIHFTSPEQLSKALALEMGELMFTL